MVSETAPRQYQNHHHQHLSADGAFRGPDLKLYVRDVRDAVGKKRPFEVKSWGTVKDAKDAIQQLLGVPVHSQRLYFGPLLSSGKELPNYRTLSDAGIYRSGETLLLDIGSAQQAPRLSASLHTDTSSSNDLVISSSLLNSTPRVLRSTIQSARRAFALGIKPDLVMDGSGGSYYIHDYQKNKIAVFKPADEEPYAENNPRGYLPSAGLDRGDSFLRQGIAPGEACIREVAAYLLDHDGVASVPMTTLCEARHPAFNTNGARLNVSQGGASIGAHSISAAASPLSTKSTTKAPLEKKVGSFQEFVRSEGSMDDLSPSMLSVEQVHKIAILDIRLLNADRNAANLLVRRRTDNSLELIPIDHGYCLRSVCDVSWMDWCWLDWPQLKEPLSKKHRDYIQKLDIESDARILSERLNICEEAIDYLRASTAILKAGVQAGLSLYDIACMCCRNDNLAEEPSLLEHLTSMASELAQIAMDNEDWHHGVASQALEEQLSPKRPSVIKSRDRSNNSRFHRCASSGEFLSLEKKEADMEDDDETTEELGASTSTFLRSNLALALEQQQDREAPPPPPLALVSGSDSSSDNGRPDVVEAEDEQIEQWAHSIIQGSFQNVIPQVNTTRSPRSGSLSSEDGSLSSSPKGFWHVRPGSVDEESSEEDASLFSFGTTPSEEAFLLPAMQSENGGRRRQSVTFADAPPTVHPSADPVAVVASVLHLPSGGPFLRPPTTVSVVQDEKHPKSLTGAQRQESIASSTGGMPRSKSCAELGRSHSISSSFGSNKASAAIPAVHRTDSLDAVDDEIVRTYFLKFIDLVIAREMARRTRQPPTPPLSS